jgi:hypothetical protein
MVALVSIAISVFVGAITFSGSIVAMAKLQGWLSTPAWTQSSVRHAVNIALAVLALVGAVLSYAVSLWGTMGLIRGAWWAVESTPIRFADLCRWDGQAIRRLIPPGLLLGVLSLAVGLLLLLAMVICCSAPASIFRCCYCFYGRYSNI